MENSKTLKEHIINALIHFLYNFFVNFIFLTPFKLWVKATERLSNQKDENILEISKITGMWPFLSFLKRFILEFLIDGFILITYFLAPIIWLYAIIKGGDFVQSTFTILIGGYFFPLLLSLWRDLIQLSTLPFKKFLSWASKPAQYLDLEIKNK